MMFDQEIAAMLAPRSLLDAALRRVAENWTKIPGKRGSQNLWRDENGQEVYSKTDPGEGRKPRQSTRREDPEWLDYQEKQRASRQFAADLLSGGRVPVADDSPEFERKSLIDAVDNGKTIDTDLLSEYRDEIVEERPDLEGEIDRLLDEAENPLSPPPSEPPNMEPHTITRTEIRPSKNKPSPGEYTGVGTSDVSIEPIYDQGRAQDPAGWKVRHTKTFKPVLYGST